MKEQKGMSHIVLIIVLMIIGFIIATVVYLVSGDIERNLIENYQTNMLQIQGKITIISQEAIIQKKDELLKGRKLSENDEIKSIRSLLEKGIISKEEEAYDKYYIIDAIELEEMKLDNIKIEEGFYIVNYNTEEVIYSEGIMFQDNTYYKLSEIKELGKKEEKSENTIVNDENVTQEEKKEEQ